MLFRRRTRVADLEVGREQVVRGRVVAGKEMSAPGSGTKCAFCETLLESFEVGARGRGRRMWLPKGMERRCDGFFVDDGSGRVWVRGDVGAIALRGGAQESGLMGKKGRQRYTGRLIRSGDVVEVRGVVSRPKGGEPGEALALAPGRKGRLDIWFRRAAGSP